MDEESYQSHQESISRRLVHLIEDIWPTIYRIINELFFGIINFIKDTISSLWRR